MENNRPIKILFINAVNSANPIEIFYPPLGPAYLASYAQKYLGKNKFEFRMISEDYEAKISEFNPDIVGITCVSQNYNTAKKLAHFSKKIGIGCVLIGGSHISLCPLSLDQNIDIGIIGEGEETFLDLARIFLAKKRLTSENLKNIKGIAYWDKKTVKINPRRELIQPLDNIPMPDRSLIKVNPDSAYMFSSRGCPYKCSFCASTRLWEKTRFHSAQYVVKEIKELVYKYGVKQINFYDDLFIAHRPRIKEIARLIKKESLDKKVLFHVSARANLVDDEICLTLKKMNVKSVSLGLESGSPEILKYLKGDSVTVEQNFKAVETIKKHGFNCIASFVIGTPIDTRKTITDTLNFIKKSKLDEFAVYALTPFPGTPIWAYAVEKNLLPSDPKKIDWDKINVEYSHSHSYNIHLAENLTREEFYELFLLFKKEQKKRKILRITKIIYTDPKRFLKLAISKTLKKLSKNS